MNFKSMILAGFFILGLMFITPQEVRADFTGWAYCSIDELGATTARDGVPYGVFSHVSSTPVFEGQVLYFDPSVTNEMLATALTAVSLNSNVWIRISGDGSTIDRLRIVMD